MEKNLRLMNALNAVVDAVPHSFVKNQVMHLTIPRVEGGRLYQYETGTDPIIVGTPAWYDWLEHHTAFLFVDLVGAFTAHKSDTNPGDQYWKAFRTRQGKRYRVHLGQLHALTLERLQAVARMLAGEHALDETTAVDKADAAASKHAVPRTAANLGSPDSLIRTKLYPPRTSSDMISRARLIERLNAGLSGGNITLVSAPAGFGKTTLLVEWVETTNRPTAWLSLDEHDNELAVFVHGLVAALQTVFPDAFHVIASLHKAPQFPSPDHVATLLINDLADVPEDVILVLDEYHTIHQSDVHTLLDRLIRHLPPQPHLVLATRSDPPLPLARWRVQGELNDLRSADLLFTLEETQAFLARILGEELAHETAVELEERTGGWIAVLRLVALSLRRAAERAAFMEQFRGYPDYSVSSYLVEEILAQQAPAVQELLIQISMLEQFCAGLCLAVLGNDASHEQVQATLDWLESTNAFIVPLDDHHEWYRFHPLFKQVLQQLLQEHNSKEEVTALHQRASGWYAEQGLIEQAIEHALAAGEALGATHLVEAQFLRAFEQERWMQLEHWLRLLPEEQIQGSSCLLVARAWILQARGQHKDFPRLLTAAEQLLGTSGSSARDPRDRQSRLLHALIAVLWSAFQYFTGQTQLSLESARSALRWIPPGEGYIASHALFFLALSNQATGRENVAVAELNKALREQQGQPTITARLLFAQALVYLAAGKLPQLEHVTRYLLQITQEADLAISHYWAHWFLGYVYYEWNNLDAAVYHFSAVVAKRHEVRLLTVQEAMCGLASAYQAQGLSTQAQETAHALIELVQGQHNLRELLTAYAFCGQLALLQDEVEQAEQWLEMAGEQEVLGPMTSFEVPPITTAWMLLAKGDEMSVVYGQALLNQVLQHVEAMRNTRKTIQVLALQAWAYDLQGHETEALEVLERALALARPGGFIRTFADVPPLVNVLQDLRKRRKARKPLDRKLDMYLQDLLAAMSSGAAPPVSTEALLQQEGLEPLTERELQILRLLDQDLTNKEIARELVLTTGTVKVHTSNVYRKLSVKNRRAAATLAKALGVLVSDQDSLLPAALAPLSANGGHEAGASAPTPTDGDGFFLD
jgi:LuxR family maltose regulon positive regulatory protein